MRLIITVLMIAAILTLTYAQNDTQHGGNYPEPATFTAQQDHSHMMNQLGIVRLKSIPATANITGWQVINLSC